jgi:hypothetical protein
MLAQKLIVFNWLKRSVIFESFSWIVLYAPSFSN